MKKSYFNLTLILMLGIFSTGVLATNEPNATLVVSENTEIQQNNNTEKKSLCEDITEKEFNSRKLNKLLEKMKNVLKEQNIENTITAPQIKENKNIILMREKDFFGERFIEYINPVITAETGKQKNLEQCKDIPNRAGIVERPKQIEGYCYNKKGEKVEFTLKGFYAQEFMHAYDHLQGITFTNKLAPNILPIVTEGDPILRKVSEDVDKEEFGTDKLNTLLDKMTATLHDQPNGVGIAAPQIGINKNILIIDLGKGPTEYINPVIEKEDGKQIFPEGCFSLPNKMGFVERSKNISGHYYNRKGEKINFKLSKFPAQVFQHEHDHLKGILFTDKLYFKHLLLN